MFFHFIIRIIGRSQKHSFRAIMGFALIIAMIISVSGVISGFSSQIFGITNIAGNSQSLYITPSSPSDHISASLLSELNHTNIDVILPLLEESIELIDENLSYTMKIVGINISTLFDFYSRAELSGGSLPTSNSTPIECIVGSELQNFLPSLDILVNHTSSGFSQWLYVSGIVQNAKEFSHAILLDLNDYLTVFNISSDDLVFQRVKILLKNGAFLQDTIDDLQSSLNDQFPNLIIKPEKQADVFTASMFADILEQLNFLFIVLFIIALIRIFHSISWFLNNYERDFLIMKACGLSSVQLFSLVGLLALIIGNAGLFVGLLFGLITPSIIFTVLSLFFQSSYVVPEFSISMILSVIISSNIIILVSATFPAVQLSFSKPNRLSTDTRGLER